MHAPKWRKEGFRTRARRTRSRFPAFGAEDKSFHQVETRIMIDRIEHCLETRPHRDRFILLALSPAWLQPKVIAGLPGINLGSGGVETLVYRLTKAVRECLQPSRRIANPNRRR